MPALLCSALKGITVLWCKRGTRSCPQQPPPPHTRTHTNTHTPLLSASSLFLPKPRRPLRPQGQLVWHRIPSPPPPLNLLLPHIYSAKQSFTYLASYLFPLQCHNLWHRPGTVTILIKNVPKLVPCSTELVKQYVLPPPSVLLNDD